MDIRYEQCADLSINVAIGRVSKIYKIFDISLINHTFGSLQVELLNVSSMQKRYRVSALKNQWTKAVHLANSREEAQTSGLGLDTPGDVTAMTEICPNYVTLNEFFSWG